MEREWKYMINGVMKGEVEKFLNRRDKKNRKESLSGYET
jgi:hypothetical protein